MRSEKARGFVLDFADVEALSNELEPADAMAVIVALSRYAKEGRRPEKGELCPAASMAFTLMVRNVDRGLENLKKRTESTRNAANARWHPQNAAEKQLYADGCERMQTQGTEAPNMQTDSDGCGCTHIESDKELEKEREEEISSKGETSSPPPPSGETEKGLLEQIAINREIEEAGRKAGIFREDWDTASPDARDEHEDFMLMLEFPKAWVLEAIERRVVRINKPRAMCWGFFERTASRAGRMMILHQLTEPEESRPIRPRRPSVKRRTAKITTRGTSACE